MSALLCHDVASIKTNQLFRPKSPFDIVCTTQRLAWSSQGFAAAPKYAEDISRGLMNEFTDASMATLGDAQMLSTGNKCAILDLYTGA